MTAHRIAALMTFVAVTLVLASAFHLTELAGAGSPPFSRSKAGVAEAIIAVVLLGGAMALRRGSRSVALGSVVFAIAGFCVGLSMTVPGGTAADVAYHAAVLPVLLLIAVGLVRLGPRPAPPGGGAGPEGLSSPGS